jgi:hypothetical protein
MSAVAQRGPPARGLSLWTEALVARGGVVLLALSLLLFLTVPLASLLVRSLEDRGGGSSAWPTSPPTSPRRRSPTRRPTRSPSPP